MRLDSVIPGVILYEAVLYTPAEAVLAPYIEEVTSPAAKQWITTNLKNWLTKQPENLFKLPYLPANATEKQQKAFSFNDLYDLRLSHGTQMKIDHMLDFLKANPELPRLERMSVDNVLAAADESVRRYNAKVGKIDDTEKDIKAVMEFPGGYRMVEMLTQAALDREGKKMTHCVGQLHGCYLTDKSRRMFSLRDANNDSYATIEVFTDGLRTTEIKGRQNAAPVRRYWPMLRQFIEQYGVVVDHDHQNIGLIKIPDANGNEETMTQEQFRDMVLDPGNVRGQELLKTYQENPREFGRRHRYGADAAMGMFTALYGSDKLQDATVAEVFAHDPQAAVQVVAHYGNRLTPEQLKTAFRHLGGSYGDATTHMKQLLQLTKPNAESANDILNELPGRISDAFVLGLAQTQPQTYVEMISDPAAMQRELDADSERSAAPFFAVSVDAITPKMINKAFEYSPVAATKRLKRDFPEIKPGLFLAAILGMASGAKAVRGTVRKDVVDGFIDYAKPNAAVVAKMFETLDRYSAKHYISDKGAYASALLMAVKNYVPEAMSKDTMEKALISIDQPDSYKEYLADDPQPSMAMQQKMLQKDKDDIDHERYGQKYLQYLRSIDPTIYQEIYQTLKPKPFETTVTRVSNGEKKVVPLDAPQLAAMRAKAIKRAGKSFITMFGSAVREPGDEVNGFINPDSPKAKQAEAAFHAMGKGALYNTAVNRINRKVLIAKSTGERYGHNRGDAALFAKHIADLPDKDIAYIIDNANYGRDKAMFGVLVDHAPERVPGVMIAKSSAYGDKAGHYGKFDYPMNKDKAFEALEAVWASNIPEGFKDNFTLAVFKRFKPSPKNLIAMMKRADNADVTLYVLKKTKKPSKELLNVVYEGWPNLLVVVPIEAMPDDLLVKLFATEPKVITAMMNRDLRDYGTESRSKWASKKFRKSINRDDPLYERYATAAKAAGKEQQFAIYVRQAELEALHPQLMRNERDDDSVDFDLLQQHLHEFSDRTLLEVAEHDSTGKVIPLYFANFSPQKMAKYIGKGLIKKRYNYSHGYASRYEYYNVKIGDIDPDTLWAALEVILGVKENQRMQGVDTLISAMVDEKYPFTVKRLGALLNSPYHGEVAKLISDPELNDQMKDWIADNKPDQIDNIRVPNAHVIEKLFDNYGGLYKDKDGNTILNKHFAGAIQSWFNKGGYWFEYQPNPQVLRMLMAETRKRGGDSLLVFQTMMRTINQLRTNRKTERYVTPVRNPIVKKAESAPEAVAA